MQNRIISGSRECRRCFIQVDIHNLSGAFSQRKLKLNHSQLDLIKNLIEDEREFGPPKVESGSGLNLK